MIFLLYSVGQQLVSSEGNALAQRRLLEKLTGQTLVLENLGEISTERPGGITSAAEGLYLCKILQRQTGEDHSISPGKKIKYFGSHYTVVLGVVFLLSLDGCQFLLVEDILTNCIFFHTYIVWHAICNTFSTCYQHFYVFMGSMHSYALFSGVRPKTGVGSKYNIQI